MTYKGMFCEIRSCICISKCTHSLSTRHLWRETVKPVQTRKHYDGLADLIHQCCDVSLSISQMEMRLSCGYCVDVLHLRAIKDAHYGIVESHGTLPSL